MSLGPGCGRFEALGTIATRSTPEYGTFGSMSGRPAVLA
jgi:hypothetical protein